MLGLVGGLPGGLCGCDDSGDSTVVDEPSVGVEAPDVPPQGGEGVEAQDVPPQGAQGEGEGEGEGQTGLDAVADGGDDEGERAGDGSGEGEGEGDGMVPPCLDGTGDGARDERSECGGEGEGEGDGMVPPCLDGTGDGARDERSECGGEGEGEGEGEGPPPDGGGEEQGECLEDADCPGARHCIEGACPELEFCFSDLDCDDERRCSGGACLDPCGPDRRCLGRMVCDAGRGLCLEAVDGGCDVAADCEGARVCRQERCEPPCYDDDDCPGSRECEFDSHTCPEASPCVVAVDCDDGARCVNFQCLRDCGLARPCPGALVCDLARQVCREGERCDGDGDCVGPRVCDGGLCHERCRDDAGGVCGGAQLCDVGTGHCVEPDACVLDADCAGLRVCDPGGDCFESECAGDDDCDEFCVDRRCADEIPGACRDDGDCANGLVCAPQGGCVDPDGCRLDGDCPAASPVCADGGCVGCAGDEDCPRVALCDDGRCLVAGPCAIDADCPGVQRCDDEAICRPAPGCEGDAFDHDADPPELGHRTYAQLMLCDGDEDVYRLTIPGLSAARIVVRHDPDHGDLSLTVTEGGQGFAVIGRSDGPFGLEVVDVAARLDDHPVDLFVRSQPGAHVPYSLTVSALDPDACPADLFEGPLGNDARDRATTIRSPGEYELRLCPGDVDWLRLPVPAGSQLLVDARAEAPPGPVAATLVGPDGEVEEQVLDPGGRATLALDIERGGDWLLGLATGVEGDRLEVQLGLSTVAAPAAEILACADEAEVQDPGAAQSRWPTHRFAVSCGDPFAPDVVTAVDVIERSAVSVRARRASAVALRRSCDDPRSELGCAAGLDPGFLAADVQPGRWFVVAQPFDVAPVELELFVRTRCDDDAGCAQGEVCSGTVCVPPCVADADCRGAQVCDPDAGRCLEADPCAADDDCLGLRQCRWDGACFLPDCETHGDCAPDQECIDRVCGDPLGECAADVDCPGDQLCAPLRACVNAGACEGPQDCPVGLDRCLLGDGRCVQCVADASCGAGNACVADRCRFAGGACEGDEDCPGERSCGPAGECLPGDRCAADRFDTPADPDGPGGPALLALRTHSALVLCDGEVDDYLVDVPEGLGLQAVLRHDAGLGDLALSFEILGPPIEILAQSDGPLGVEQVSVAAAQAPAQVGVIVRGRPGASVPYSLSLSAVPAGQCRPDALEGLLGNDGPARATRVGPGESALTICPRDEDWFEVRLPAGVRLDAALRGDAIADQLRLTILDAAGQQLAVAVDDGQGLAASVVAQVPGAYRLRVVGQVAQVEAAATLELSVTAAAGAEGLACGHPVELEPEISVEFPRAPAVDRFSVGCGLALPGLTADHLGSFSLPEPAAVTLRAANAGVMALRRSCDDPDSEVICGDAGDPIWQALPLDAGPWWLVVQSTDQQTPRVRLTVD